MQHKILRLTWVSRKIELEIAIPRRTHPFPAIYYVSKVIQKKKEESQQLTQRISSGLYSSLHFKVSFNILAAFLTFQFRALKYLEMHASEQKMDALPDCGPINLLTWNVCDLNIYVKPSLFLELSSDKSCLMCIFLMQEDIAHEAETGKTYRTNYIDKHGRTVLVMRPSRQV